MKKVLVVLFSFLFLVGCSSKKSSIDLEKIKTDLLNSSYFKNHEVVSKDTIEKKYSLNLENTGDVIMIVSKDYDDASMVLIADNNIKSEIDKFVSSYNDQWVKMNYFPEEAELVKSAIYKTSGDYVIYIVSKDSDKVLKLINL